MGFHNVDTSGIALDLSTHEISCLQIILWNEQTRLKAWQAIRASESFCFMTYGYYGASESGARISVDKGGGVSSSTPIRQIRGSGR